jgi:hypothetical protein
LNFCSSMKMFGVSGFHTRSVKKLQKHFKLFKKSNVASQIFSGWFSY